MGRVITGSWSIGRSGHPPGCSALFSAAVWFGVRLPVINSAHTYVSTRVNDVTVAGSQDGYVCMPVLCAALFDQWRLHLLSVWSGCL